MILLLISMKKFTNLIYTFLFAVSIVSCSDQTKDYVRFYNYDGRVLWQTEYYDGMILKYEGETPSRPSDNVYNYTFTGWNHSFDEVKDYRNFYALYIEEIRSFTVTFTDYNGSILKTVSVRYGDNATQYAPDNPTRNNELRKHYYFSHWEGGDLTYVVSDIICRAVYDVVNCYEIKYYDYDDSLLKIEYLEEGSNSEFDFDSYRNADEDHFYLFDGWDIDVVNVQHDMTVHATYRIVNAFTVTFLNYDGTLLSTSRVPSGYDANYKGNTPERSSVTSGKYKTDYIFKGWDKDLTNIHSSFSTTAQFKEDRYNYTYRSALNSLISFCKAGRYEADENQQYMIYENKIKSGYSGSMYEFISAIYRPWDDVCYLDYFLENTSSNVKSRTRIKIYLPANEPGNYNVYYTYHCASFDSDGLSFFGTTKFTSSFSYSSSISFENYTNLGTTTLYDNQQVCAGMINNALTYAKSNSYFHSHDLGFNNY